MNKRDFIFGIIVNALSILVLFGTTVFLLVYWNQIPEIIPGHYNAAGEVDRWTSKNELITLPVSSWILFLLFSVIEHFPQTWNTGVRVTQENMVRVYHATKQLLVLMKLWLVLLFAYLTVNTALGVALSIWFLPVVLVVIFGTIALHFIKLLRVK